MTIQKIKQFYLKNEKLLKLIVFIFISFYFFIISIISFLFFLDYKDLENKIEKQNLIGKSYDNELKILEEKQKKIELEKMQEELFLKNLDFKSDDSLQTFVTSNISFNNKSYIPKNLVNIRWNYIYDSKWWTQKLRIEAKDALVLLSEQFYNNFSKKIEIVSAYRSYEYQVWIKSRGCPDNLCAKAWFSEHQTGLAFDIFEASSDSEWKNNKTLMSYYKWLDENAHLYWFHNTYKRWLAIDWYDIELWHWRYLWVELATYLYENNLTLAEFYKQRNN